MKVDDFDDETLQRNRICDVLKTFFQHRSCFTLVQPVDQNSQLASLKDMEWSEMNEEFRAKAEIIYEHLMTKIKPMGLNGQEFDGNLFTFYIEKLVQQINTGVLPNIEDTYTYICRTKSH